MSACSKAPAGWRCSRAAGHDGPCAAHPVSLDRQHLPPHRVRLLEETDELNGRRERLRIFLSRVASGQQQLDRDEAGRMTRQLELMDLLAGVLRERLAAAGLLQLLDLPMLEGVDGGPKGEKVAESAPLSDHPSL